MTKRSWIAVCFPVLVALACGGISGFSAGEDSETHFLDLCEATCGKGLSCICGVCTVTCDPAQSCSALSAKASCRTPDGKDVSLSCEEDSQPSICDVTCESDRDCKSLSADHACLNGACRRATCSYNGEGYAAGQQFPAKDGCNTCTCTKSGEVSCTDKECAPGSGMCEYDGKSYPSGSNFPSTDGCNTCTCTKSGEVPCTDKECAPGSGMCEYDGKSYPLGSSFPSTDGCNTCTCSEDGVGCTLRGCVPTCEYEGKEYAVGADIPSAGCSCVCASDGTIECKEPSVCDPCSLPFEVGPCDAIFRVFWHNPETGLCEEKTYGGCEGNANRFDTREECEAKCGGGSGSFAGCEVDGKAYPHGAQGVPDYQSCNTCTCNDGVVAGCTEINCPRTCPDGEAFGTECAQCSPIDACEVVRSGCLKQCSAPEDCADSGGLCIDGLCRNLCG